VSNRDEETDDIMPGALDRMVLQTVATFGPLHGYTVAARWDRTASTMHALLREPA
jgi:hypothetical protein